MTLRFARLTAVMAVASMAVMPAQAAQLPAPAAAPAVTTSVFHADGQNAHSHRRYRRDRVDAGDVIGGILVLGTIAAVASAASNAGRKDRYRDGGYRADYRRPYDSRFESRGLQNAADMCAREVDRDRRVESVDNVTRTGEGWRVSGRVRSGEGFTCLIDNDGRIADVDYGPAGYTGVADDRQWSDDRYAAARAAQDARPAPAYPGGPIGDEVDDIPPVGSTASDYAI